MDRRRRENSVKDDSVYESPQIKSKGKEKTKQNNQYSKAETQRMLLSPQTREGLRFTDECMHTLMDNKPSTHCPLY